MKDKDADLLVDIPDTPDRLPVERVSGVLIARHLRSHDPRDAANLESRRSKCRLVNENGQNRKVHIHPQRDSGNLDQMECSNNVIVLPPSKNSHPSQNGPLFRRSAMDRNSKREANNSTRAQLIKHDTQNSARVHHMDKGKAICSEFPSRSIEFSEDDAVLDLTELNEHEMLDLAFPRCVPFGVPSEQQKKDHVPLNCGSDVHADPRPSASPSNICKAKGKIGENRYEGLGMPIGITGDLPHKVEKQPSLSHISIASPRVAGRKRLVRNGCISPQNIKIKSRQVIEHKPNSSKDVQQSHHREVISKDQHSMLDREVVADDGSSGQRETNHPNISTRSDVNPIHISSRPQVNKEDGWRSTHNRLNTVAGQNVQQLNNGRTVRRDSLGKNTVAPCGTMIHTAPQTASTSVSNLSSTNMLCKRQKRHESGLRDHGESSRLVPDDSNIIVLGSPRETSRSRSYTFRNHRQTGTGPSQVRQAESNPVGGVNNDNSEARARQLEADEMLARELQEQLYHEAPIAESDVIDEAVVWALQQEEASNSSLQAHHLPNPRNSRRRQPQLRSSQNPLTRRRNRSQTTTRMSQLRSEVLGRSSASFPWTSNARFPPGMDLEMRLNILEALENAIGDLGDSGLSNNMFQVQRDFNENDYEMLLALDENNHRHGGASGMQINSLPESTVQTDNFGEDCAICLETPGIGETIRHLPCLHKFHKACIDPWLSRKTSCPVCKSSIT